MSFHRKNRPSDEGIGVKSQSTNAQDPRLWSLRDGDDLHNLSWHWWFWLIFLTPREDRPASELEQCMILWSTKDCRSISMSGHLWERSSRPRLDSGVTMDGVVASWWWDGHTMHEPWRFGEGRMHVEGGEHPIVAPLWSDAPAVGYDADHDRFWIDVPSINDGGSGPDAVQFVINPHPEREHTITHHNNMFTETMGYDIHRLRRAQVQGIVDGIERTGTAYLQKVTVDAPPVPWFWGLVHLKDGSYIDWFMPHLGGSMMRRTSQPWSILGQAGQVALRPSGLFIDERKKRRQRFSVIDVKVERSDQQDTSRDDAPLPRFTVLMVSGRVRISILATACSRAAWVFDQQTVAGLSSHLTYNEYPLSIEQIIIEDETGKRKLDASNVVGANAEHAWGWLF